MNQIGKDVDRNNKNRELEIENPNWMSKLIVVCVHKWTTFIDDNSWQSPLEKATKANFRIENQEKLRWFLCDGHKSIWIWSSRRTHMCTLCLYLNTANDHDRKQLDFSTDLDRFVQNDLNVKVHKYSSLYINFICFFRSLACTTRHYTISRKSNQNSNIIEREWIKWE